MKQKTVKQKIFQANTWMILIIMAAVVLINLGVIAFYTEHIEHEWNASMANILNEDQMEELITDWTIQRSSFRILAAADLLLCIAVFVVVSSLFTSWLTKHIEKPLNLLAEGAERIRNGNLNEPVQFSGAREFEEVCDTFNEMQRHIRQEQEKNRKYEKSRTDMIAGISHDLRTPLTAVKGTIKAMLDGIAQAPEQQKNFLNVAYRRTGEMDALLNQLFYISKLETGNMPVQMTLFNLAEFLKSYVRGKTMLFEEQVVSYEKNEQPETQKQNKDSEKISIELELKGADQAAWIEGDPEQIQRILDNLLENSRKYAEQQELKISLELALRKETVTLKVRDNGVGVPDAVMPHIFDEFYRGDEARSSGEGNGLGLYIVKYLMQAMHGKVWAENETGLAVSLQFPKVTQPES